MFFKKYKYKFLNVIIAIFYFFITFPIINHLVPKKLKVKTTTWFVLEGYRTMLNHLSNNKNYWNSAEIEQSEKIYKKAIDLFKNAKTKDDYLTICFLVFDNYASTIVNFESYCNSCDKNGS